MDTVRGSGWWLASDGRWYPPEQRPGGAPPPAPPPPASGPSATAISSTSGLPAAPPLAPRRNGRDVAVSLVLLAALIAGGFAFHYRDDLFAGRSGPDPSRAASEQPVRVTVEVVTPTSVTLSYATRASIVSQVLGPQADPTVDLFSDARRHLLDVAGVSFIGTTKRASITVSETTPVESLQHVVDLFAELGFEGGAVAPAIEAAFATGKAELAGGRGITAEFSSPYGRIVIITLDAGW